MEEVSTIEKVRIFVAVSTTWIVSTMEDISTMQETSTT